MSISSAAVVLPRSFATTIATTFRRAAGAMGLAAASAGVASAQSAATTLAPSSPTWELRFTSGALVATGEQRDVVKDGQLSAVRYRRVAWCRLKRTPAVSITSLRVSEVPVPIRGLKPLT